MRRDAVITAFFCFLLGGFVMYDTASYPDVSGQGFGRGPAFYPRVLAGALLCFGLLSLIRALRNPRRIDPAASGAAKSSPAPEYGNIAGLMLLSIGFTLLVKPIGFFAAGFLLSFALARLIRGVTHTRRIVSDLLFSAGVILLVYVIFELFIGIRLPRAMLFL